MAEKPVLSREALLSALAAHPEFLREGVTAEKIADEAFRGQFEVSIRETLASDDVRASEKVVKTELEKMTALVVKFSDAINDYVKIIPGDPTGKQSRSKADRQTLDVRTSHGTFRVWLIHD